MYKKLLCAACFVTLLTAMNPAIQASAQLNLTNDSPNLAPNSPYHDPDIIYLEADELLNNEENQTLTARGSVEGRYQDKTIRADEVIYYLNEGRVIATGEVIIINADGTTQHAEKIQLSNKLETGNASNFTARNAEGGIIGAAYAARRTDDGVDLYNAYYTACEPCRKADGKTQKPTWQLKARHVQQDTNRNMILYKDAVFELFGLPVFYTPYLAHPDPSQKRASGWLNPFGGYSNSKGAFLEAPYYIAIDDYTELTLTPQIYTKVNPLLAAQFRRKFYSGELNINSSITYGSAFDRNGDPFLTSYDYGNSTITPPTGKKIRSHFFADGEFSINENWDWGFTAQLSSDDLHLRRYDIAETRPVGLYQADSRRLISQLFSVGQNDNFRFSASTYGFQSLRTNIRESNTLANTFRISGEDDSTLPIIAPKIEASYYIKDPILNGRLQAFGDFIMLNRKLGYAQQHYRLVAEDYQRASAGLSWNKTLILPGGIEAKPFGEVRYDNFNITPYDDETDTQLEDFSFDRTIGQVGMDIRWPFIKSSQDFDFIIEPRAMITQNFGNGQTNRLKLDNDQNGEYDEATDYNYLQDSLEIDLDQNLIWSPNKSTGYDLWQKGFRADVGGSVSAIWNNNYASLFVGQSFANNADDIFEIESGLKNDKSDLVGQFELGLSKKFRFDTRLRYDDDDNEFRRLDTGFRYTGSRLSGSLRYYQIDRATATLNDADNDISPAEEINGSVRLKLMDNWNLRYSAVRDLDRDITRQQIIGLGYRDACTQLELFYTKRNSLNNISGNSDTIGIRVSLLSLGDFGVSNEEERF